MGCGLSLIKWQFLETEEIRSVYWACLNDPSIPLHLARNLTPIPECYPLREYYLPQLL